VADEPRKLNPQFGWLGPYGRRVYNFDLYRAHGSDSIYFINPDEPLPWEADGGALDLQLGKEDMTELRDLLTHLLDNWGKTENNPPDRD